jgi:hypothetical protein
MLPPPQTSTLKMEEALSSETPVHFHETTQCHIPEDCNIHSKTVGCQQGLKNLMWTPTSVRSIGTYVDKNAVCIMCWGYPAYVFCDHGSYR